MPDTRARISQLKERLGDNLCIVGHHYQHDSIIQHCDITGDSLELARKVASNPAPHIVFCGVFFMAESAALLAQEGQKIYLPENAANCVMAKMTPSTLLTKVLEGLNASRKVVPLAYVNTSLAVKAVVGRFGGAVCTSANARTMLAWAQEQCAADDKGAVLFLPDKHLGRNTAKQLGMDSADWHILDVRSQKGAKPEPDLDAAQAPLLLWPGCCAIHAKFKPEHITQMREDYPGCRVIVHPECAPEVVDLADGAGSTSYLIEQVRTAPPGSTVIVGTETNLVERLRAKYADHCQVVRLRRAFCSHMAKITEEKLLATLEAICSKTALPVSVPAAHKAPARAALSRMLETCAKAGV